MKLKKVFIRGMVDARLKRRFLQELRKMNRGAAEPITQSGFLEMLLLEGVNLRKKRIKRKVPSPRSKA